VPQRLLELDGYWAHWHGEGGYSGVALLISKALSPTRPAFTSPSFDMERRITVAALDDVDVASIYVPNGGKDFDAKIRFLEAMRDWVAVRHAAGRKLLLCGDFNVSLTELDVHEKLRNSKETGQTEGERGLMGKVLSHGLTDLGRKFAPDDANLFTWWAPWRQYRERNIGWRLDLVLSSPALTERATKCTALREFGTSDHMGLRRLVSLHPRRHQARRQVGPALLRPPSSRVGAAAPHLGRSAARSAPDDARQPPPVRASVPLPLG
jgi:exodeoxyribonuclease-3